jgi:Ca2+-binding EF-hand superfamily protein
MVNILCLWNRSTIRTGRGFINKAQLGELMDTLGIDATAEEVDLMLSEIDLGS